MRLLEKAKPKGILTSEAQAKVSSEVTVSVVMEMNAKRSERDDLIAELDAEMVEARSVHADRMSDLNKAIASAESHLADLKKPIDEMEEQAKANLAEAVGIRVMAKVYVETAAATARKAGEMLASARRKDDMADKHLRN